MKLPNKGALFIGLAAVMVGTALGLVALGGHKSTGPTAGTVSTSGAVATTAVKIQDYMFSPMVIRVKAGSTVTWTNEDQVHHSITADTISADAPNGLLIGQGQSYHFTFKKAGTYTFHCMPHPYMHGTVVVTS